MVGQETRTELSYYYYFQMSLLFTLTPRPHGSP